MKRFLIFFAALGALLLFHGEALASHFRYGNINWVVPNPQLAPNTVKFTVTYAIVAGSGVNLQDITLDFGDASNNGPVIGAIIGGGTDAGGQQYEVREFTATHAYAAAGTFTAFFQDCCRITELVNGGGGNADYRVETKVVLQAGNVSGPVTASPAFVQLQLGGTRQFTWPVLDPDGDPATCRFGTQAETGFANPIPVVPNPPGPGNGGQSPTVANVPGGCQLTWDLIDAQLGQRYVVHIVFESTHNGQISSTQLDLIVEIINAPTPVCTGSGLFIVESGQAFSTMVTGTNNVAANLLLGAINAPVGSTLMPNGTQPSPFTTTFSWTPTALDQGTTTIIVTNFTNPLNHTGSCFLTIQVPQCADYGDPCVSGVGQCAVAGTNVCAGPNVTVCDAIPGAPGIEICDGLDNDCDGTADDGNPGAGLPCPTGLPGDCSTGTTTCTAGAPECVPDVLPDAQMELCNGEDDDCDGAIDDGFNLGGACSNGMGACAQAGVFVCDGDGAAECNAVPGLPTAEICGDGVDQNCDGVADDGCLDTDGDGLFDDQEILIGTDPNDADTDDDGVIDGEEPSLSEDADDDGLINALDPDSDNDGLFDGTEMGKDCSNPATNVQDGHCIPDGDMGTTTTDPLDADTDNGGVNDGAEDANLDGTVDAGETDPTAGNGADDGSQMNDDSDGDGLTDAVEIFIGTDPNDADSDDDGVIDGEEPNPADDHDGDGLINALDPDSDNDGLFDGTEMGVITPNPATDIGAGFFIPDADPTTFTSPLDADTDDGGVSDGAEDVNHNGAIDAGETDPTAGHGADDATILDTDGDGLSDAEEDVIGTDKNDADTDDDGVIDGAEANPTADTDGDGFINALDPDSDDDGLFDGTEVGVTTPNADTNVGAGFFIPDADPTTKTSPLLADTDGGGAFDGAEDTNKNGAVDAGERDPTKGHGDDDFDDDSDEDGLTDDFEISIGTNPNDADTDDDGVPDGQELQPGTDSDGDGLVNAADPDSDNDGLFDGTEMGYTTADPDTDLTKGTFIPDADPNTETNPLDADTDDGGVSDGAEDINQNGAVDGEETNPTVGNGADDNATVDTDGDGLSDEQEEFIGTDPNDADSDDDGVIDGEEPNPTADTDGDNLINALDPDSDGDGLFDGTEMGKDCSDPDTDAAAGNCIPDGDNGATTTSPVIADTDGGTVSDGDEDANHNGVVDEGETDPTAGHGADDIVTPPECEDDSDCGDEQSGLVCNPDTNECEDGCHTPGNGCPTDEICTSDDETIGQCVECTEDAHCGGAQSGLVCNPVNFSCIQGCHESGNGCPDGQTCSAGAAEEIGQCTPDDTVPEQVVAEGSGLICAARPANDNGSAAWLVTLALGGLLAARRRRR